MRAVVVALVMLVALVACDGDAPPDEASVSRVAVTTVAVTTVAVTPGASAPAAGTPTGFERVAATAVTADGTVCELCLWMADTADLRRRGLMGVTDLGEADGMVFRYASPTSTGFWMKDTLLPLSVAFYSAGGNYLGEREMQPCTADPCPTYTIDRSFALAVETTLGGLATLGLTAGSTLTLHDRACPASEAGV